MSVLLNFAIFPTDKGDSVSKYVSEVIRYINKSSYPYQLTSMGTIVETANLDQALEIINNSYRILEPYSDRVYITSTIDIQKNKKNRINNKIKSIEDKIGIINK